MDGRPAASVRTSASVHCMPPGAPSALARASLAANRAASDCGERAAPDSVTCSAAVNSRSARPGVRRSAAAKRATGTTSMPTPTITRQLLVPLPIPRPTRPSGEPVAPGGA